MTEHAPATPDAESVVNELLELAEQLAEAARELDSVTIVEVVRGLGARAEEARGEARRLFEVAEAFARTHSLLRGDFGRLGRTAARFVRDHGSAGAEVLRGAESNHGLAVDDVPESMLQAVRTLLNEGVLREADDGRLRVRMSVRGVVAQLLYPPMLRMWSVVETARARAKDVSEPHRARFLAEQLGLDVEVVRHHLERSPIRARSGGPRVARRVRGLSATTASASQFDADASPVSLQPSRATFGSLGPSEPIVH